MLARYPFVLKLTNYLDTLFVALVSAELALDFESLALFDLCLCADPDVDDALFVIAHLDAPFGLPNCLIM